MCGIAGAFSYHDLAGPVDRDELLRVREAMRARGPDGAGLWMSADQRTGLAHRRLAIIDIERCRCPPMTTGDGGLRITFNGEIYNYRELRQRAGGEGLSLPFRTPTQRSCFISTTSAERTWCMHCGACTLSRFGTSGGRACSLRGILSVSSPCITQTMARSSVSRRRSRRCVKGGESIRRRSRPESVGFLVWGSVPEPYTLYRGIRALPAGASLRVSRGGSGVTISRFFDISDELRGRNRPRHRESPTRETCSRKPLPTVCGIT